MHEQQVGELLYSKGLTNAAWTPADWNGDRAVRALEGDYVLYADGTIDKVEDWGTWPPTPPPAPEELGDDA